MTALHRSILLAAMTGFAFVIYGGFQPDGYLIHVRGITAPQPYPFAAVGFFALLVLVASVILYAVLRWPATLNVNYRLLFAALLFGAWTSLLAVTSMHQTPYYFGHLLWVFSVTVVLIAALIGSLFKRLFLA
jgi:hypothetical protein